MDSNKTPAALLVSNEKWPCLVKGCSGHPRSYQIPLGNSKFWYANLGIKVARRRSRVCAKHFVEECLSLNRLRMGSVPTENLGRDPVYVPKFSKHQRRSIKKAKTKRKDASESLEKVNEDETQIEDRLSADGWEQEEDVSEFDKYIVEDPQSDSETQNTHSEMDGIDIEDHSQSELSLQSINSYLKQRNNELQAEAECLPLENSQLRMENISLKKSFEIHKNMYE